jgi:hypothetical protein
MTKVFSSYPYLLTLLISHTYRAMESLVDLVTTSFQAVAGVAVVFTAGYAINTKQDAKFASVNPTLFPSLENRS